MCDRDTRILKAATRLFLRDGVGVSTARIAAEAGVSNGTLFNVFPTKQALIDGIYTAAKQAMFATLVHSGSAPFDRARLYDNWQGYLAWARANPDQRAVMHLLAEAGLVSETARNEMDRLAAPHAAWVNGALESGAIRGPSASFVAKLVFFQIDLVITESLPEPEADLAFAMLCNALGLAE
jgi:AcrR family transcriptional regulator